MEAQGAALAVSDDKDSKPRKLNILICTPTLGTCEAGMAFSLARAMTFFATLPYEGEKSVGVEMIASSNLAESRTRLVARAMTLEATV